ncbi:MAG TPA: hypothetical protein VFO91_08455 [Anaerolineales bacterium]|nr:hypothetical protein [Anaerolineales bacterium]
MVRALYKKLLSLYPRVYKERFGQSIEQTFNDLYNEQKRQMDRGLISLILWLWIFLETALGIIKEHTLLVTEGYTMRTIMTNPKLAALVGLFFIVPFALLNAIVGNRIEPFFSLIRPAIHTGPHEYLVLFIVLLLIPVGSYIALQPILHRGAEGRRRFYPVSVLLAAVLLMVFVTLSAALGSEIYRCDVLQIPNCD